jgi:hypothetical protein
VRRPARRPEGGGWRCEYGTWHGIDEHCRCAGPAAYLTPGLTPTDLPGHRAGVTWRFHVADHQTLIKRAVLEHAPQLEGATS